MGFSKNRATKLHSWGWATKENVWEVAEGRCDSIEERGDKFVLSFK
jgi:hypothetical protein